ncbi:MAG: hypothetical protein AB7I27_10485 [Bacteriovoracaceae bacterium]
MRPILFSVLILLSFNTFSQEISIECTGGSNILSLSIPAETKNAKILGTLKTKDNSEEILMNVTVNSGPLYQDSNYRSIEATYESEELATGLLYSFAINTEGKKIKDYINVFGMNRKSIGTCKLK